MSDDYNKSLEDFEKRGVIRKIPEKEMEDWKCLVNYIMHQDILNLKSATTQLQVVSNSSLVNNNSGNCLNVLLPKGLDALVSLLECLVAWRPYKHTMTWALDYTHWSHGVTSDEIFLKNGNTDEDFTVYGLQKKHLRDSLAMCALEVAN